MSTATGWDEFDEDEFGGDEFDWSGSLGDEPWTYGGLWEEPEPRWSPDRPLAERITRLGRWSRVDPLERGRLWNRREWAAFGLWGALVAGGFGLAWRRHRA